MLTTNGIVFLLCHNNTPMMRLHITVEKNTPQARESKLNFNPHKRKRKYKTCNTRTCSVLPVWILTGCFSRATCLLLRQPLPGSKRLEAVCTLIFFSSDAYDVYKMLVDIVLILFNVLSFEIKNSGR